MTDAALRGKAVQAVIEAVQTKKPNDYSSMATYVSDKFDAEEAGNWACYTAPADNRPFGLRYTYFNNNTIDVRVGSIYFSIWQQSK